MILFRTRSYVKAGCHKACRCAHVLPLTVCTYILHTSLTCVCPTLLPYTVRSHHYLTDPRLLTHTSSHVNCRALSFVRARLHRFRAIVRKQRAHIISSSPVKCAWLSHAHSVLQGVPFVVYILKSARATVSVRACHPYQTLALHVPVPVCRMYCMPC